MPPSAYQHALHRLAAGTCGATLLLLVAGALVTSHDAGLSVPDWPLSYGSLLPPMVGGVLFEHGHRLVAGVVLLLTAALAIQLARREPRLWVRRLGWLALAAVVAQAVLGGLTVLLMLPKGISMAHATLAQLFFCALVAISLFTSRAWHAEAPAVEEGETSRLRNLAAAACAAIFVQLILGAGFRHRAFGILPHLIGAAVVATLAYRAAAVARDSYGRVAPLRRPAALLAWLVTLQLALGGGALAARLVFSRAAGSPPALVLLTVAHVAVGALTFAVAVVLALWSYRVLRPARGPVAASKADTVAA